MTIRSKQWYTNTSRLPNSFVNVSIGRPPLIESRQQDHRSDGRWSQNFKYVWLAVWRRNLWSLIFLHQRGLVLPTAFQLQRNRRWSEARAHATRFHTRYPSALRFTAPMEDLRCSHEQDS